MIADPYRAVEGLADPGSWDCCSDVKGDPISYSDPSGLESCYWVDDPHPCVETDANNLDTGGAARLTSSQQRRQRRLEWYEQVMALFQAGHAQSEIGRELHMERKTVRRWLRRGQFPERKPPNRRPPKVSEFADYLQRRWNEGCHNASRLSGDSRQGVCGQARHGGPIRLELANYGQANFSEGARESRAPTCRHPGHPSAGQALG